MEASLSVLLDRRAGGTLGVKMEKFGNLLLLLKEEEIVSKATSLKAAASKDSDVFEFATFFLSLLQHETDCSIR